MNSEHPANWNKAEPEILPEPTYWPMALALASTLLAWGLLTTWIITAVGLALFVISLSGWIGDLVREHREEAKP